VGVEHAALHAIAQLGLVEKLTNLGLSAVGRACILGNLIGRMAEPASELATWEWLQANSALGELLDVDFAGLSHMRLYRASDALMQRRDAIESHVFDAVTGLFALQGTVTLYDLTNTYFEGAAELNDKACAWALQRETKRLPAGDAGTGARRQWLCAPLQDL
jgi:hypothetical protein